MADGGVRPVNGHAGAVLHNHSEPFRKLFGGFPGYLPGNDIAGYIHDHIGLIFPIILFKLAKVLSTQRGRHLVATYPSGQLHP